MFSPALTLAGRFAQIGGESGTIGGFVGSTPKEAIPVENVKFEVVDDNRLVIHVDLNHRGDISASGKTRRVASTQGNIGVKDANGVEVTIGLNVYVKPNV